MYTIKGIPASEGIAISPIYLYQPQEFTIPRRTDTNPDAEWWRLQKALEQAEAELAALHQRLVSDAGESEAQILEAHMMILQDPVLIGEARNLMVKHLLNAEAAFNDVVAEQVAVIESLDDPYLAARGADMRDVAYRVTRILLGLEARSLADLVRPSILVAHDLTPSDTAALDKRYVLGFCTAVGGPTAHTAILARSLGLPAIVGAGEQVMEIEDNALLILDGGKGELIVSPDVVTQEIYRTRQTELLARIAIAKASAQQPAYTLDGHQVEVVANIGTVAEAETILGFGAEGVGLLRTEFLYLEQTKPPSEEEQYQAYHQIVHILEQRPLVLRTLDIGGDKPLPYLHIEAEENPFLGQRGIRLLLAAPELFKVQLRAILRASRGHNLKIMFPMVATVEEVRQTKALLAEARAELEARGLAYGQPEVGIMIEIPAAAVAADLLAREVDFFSIGTNDLTQYTLAVDRTNTWVQSLADALHPAVLRLIAETIRKGHEAGIWVGLCGELAGNPLAVPILLGLGLDEFSLAAPSIPAVKTAIRQWSRAGAKAVAEAALQQENAAAVRQLLQNSVPQ